MPTERQVQPIINREAGQWGTEYQGRYDSGRVAMRVATTEVPLEEFTIRVDSARNQLVMQ